MKNIEKIELKRDIRDLVNNGYEKKEAVKILVGYGYCKSTTSRYWDVFAEKFAINVEEVVE
jgi:hypothetical protein